MCKFYFLPHAPQLGLALDRRPSIDSERLDGRLNLSVDVFDVLERGREGIEIR